MKKQILNLGKVLNKAEQKIFFGGDGSNHIERCVGDQFCETDEECPGSCTCQGDPEENHYCI